MPSKCHAVDSSVCVPGNSTVVLNTEFAKLLCTCHAIPIPASKSSV